MVNDELIISALTTNKTIREAAKVAKVSEATIYNRLRDKDFLQSLDYRRLDMLQGVVSAAQDSMLEAINTIKSIMLDEGVAAKDRLLAAESLIRQSKELSSLLTGRLGTMRFDDMFGI